VQLFRLVAGSLLNGAAFLLGFDLPAVQLVPERNNHVPELADLVVGRGQSLLDRKSVV